MSQEADGRRWFGPALLLGVAGCALGALAGDKPWASPDARAGSALVDRSGGHVPLAGALGLVGLAVWGVLLVTRGLVRRLAAVLGAVVAVALVTTAVVGRSSALDSARRATVDVTGTSTTAHLTAWWYAGLVAAVVALLGAAYAVRYARAWPEMGSRYDAPGGGAPSPDPAHMEDLDVWRAIDEGRDPTDGDAH